MKGKDRAAATYALHSVQLLPSLGLLDGVDFHPALAARVDGADDGGDLLEIDGFVEDRLEERRVVRVDGRRRERVEHGGRGHAGGGGGLADGARKEAGAGQDWVSRRRGRVDEESVGAKVEAVASVGRKEVSLQGPFVPEIWRSRRTSATAQAGVGGSFGGNRPTDRPPSPPLLLLSSHCNYPFSRTPWILHQ